MKLLNKILKKKSKVPVQSPDEVSTYYLIDQVFNLALQNNVSIELKDRLIIIYFLSLMIKSAAIDEDINDSENIIIDYFTNKFSILIPELKDIKNDISNEDKECLYYLSKLRNLDFLNVDIPKLLIIILIDLFLSDNHLQESEMQILKIFSDDVKINYKMLLYLIGDRVNNLLNKDLFLLLNSANSEMLTKNYHKVIRKYHPDFLQHQGNIAAEYLSLINYKFNMISEYYQSLKKEFIK